jgi:SNF2 family DNA or RNA helicase
LKSEVLDQLPPKTRQKILINVEKSKIEEIMTILSLASKLSLQEEKNDDQPRDGRISILKRFKNKKLQTNHLMESKYKYYMENSTSLNLFQKAYKLTGISKVNGIIEFCNNLVDEKLKFLIFAHHITVLDQLENNFKKKKVKYIRIDGKVKAKERFDHVGK